MRVHPAFFSGGDAMPNDPLQNLTRRTFLQGVGAAAALAAPARVISAELRSRAASSKVVRIGIVGGNFGSAFQWHVDPNCKVTALCDLRDDRLKHMVEVYGPAQTYKNFRQFLKHPELDAVGVFTPAPLHV
jgi:hypothetical protein